MVNRFFFCAFVLIGVLFSSTNAMKRKRVDNQPFEVNKKFCTNDFLIDTSDFDLLYGTNYLQEPINLQMAGNVFKYIPNQNYDKKIVKFFLMWDGII